MQLDAALCSFFLRCQDASGADVVVLFRATTPRHLAQYRELQEEYLGRARFLPERNFRAQVLNELTATLHSPALYGVMTYLGPLLSRLLLPRTVATDVENVMFLVDDNIFIRDFSLTDAVDALEAYPTALGLSFRLGENTTYCYPLDAAQTLPPFKPAKNGLYIYSWVDGDADFGYPLELSSSIYRIKEILPFQIGLPFRNPNSLEGEMASRSHLFATTRPDLLCYPHSVAFCVPANRVQNVISNRVGLDMAYTSEGLAQLFDQGQRIDVQQLINFTPNACHQEIPLPLKKASF